VKLPVHSIMLGSASALPTTLRPRQSGTFRYVPGPLKARELSRLVDASISAGTWEESAADNGAGDQLEEVDIEETIESAAAGLYRQASRKRQRFNTVVTGPSTHVLGDPTRLRQTFAVLLRLTVSLAPLGAAIAVEAQAGSEEWVIKIRASTSGRGRRGPGQMAEGLREETKTISAASRDIQEQGGMFWVELLGPAAFALCLTLPLPAEAKQSVSA
jgi:hypothetical protein